MTLTLFIVAVTGLAIFIIAYLRIIIASFRHHAVTGLISIVPGINLAVLPTVWAHMSKVFSLSVLGLAMTLGGWYAGGNQYLDNRKMKLSTKSANTQVAQSPVVKQSELLPVKHKIKELPLPQKPLYYIRFQKVPISKLDSLLNQYIRIKLIDDRELEGKNIESSSSTLLIETFNNDNRQVVKVSMTHIKTLEKLVRSER